MNLAGWVGKRFDQVPFVSENVPENRDFAVGLGAGLFQKLNLGPFEFGVVAAEIIGFQDEENPPTRLVSYGGRLIRRISLGEQQAGFHASRGRYDDPSLATGKDRILEEIEAESAHIEGYGLVIIGNQKCYG